MVGLNNSRILEEMVSCTGNRQQAAHGGSPKADFHKTISSQEDVAGLVGFFLHQRGSASSTSSFWGGPGCYTRPGLALNKGLPEYGFK